MTKAPKAPKCDGETKKLNGGTVKTQPGVQPKQVGHTTKKKTNP